MNLKKRTKMYKELKAKMNDINQKSRGYVALIIMVCLAVCVQGQPKFRRLPVQEYRDKMKAGWIGQMIGVAWGAPVEGKFLRIMPAQDMPPFSESLVNDAFGQDDLYVEMTFLRTLEQHGYDVPIRQAGIDFANSRYSLSCANRMGRINLRNGIAPPDASHPKFHNCAGAIDYQIEADYAGLISPGMPNAVIKMGEKFGRLMNYGDGVYAGQFMGAMYAEAFFEKDPVKLIKAGLEAIPSGCMYAEMVRDMLKWRVENPEWEKTWELMITKYHRNKEYNISDLDVKREGALVLMGLLYGEGDLDKTMIISCRGGFDSDCNPSSCGGILFTTLGVSKLPTRYYSQLDEKKEFNYTAYNFPALLEVCEKLTRQALLREGGRIEKNADGTEVFLVPVKPVIISSFENLKNPGSIAASTYSDEEMRQIDNPGLKWALPHQLASWKADGIRDGSFWWKLKDRSEVFEFISNKPDSAWTLTRTVTLPANRETKLTLCQGKVNDAWNLAITVGESELMQKSVSPEAEKDSWQDIVVDLTRFAGKTITLRLTGMALNKAAMRPTRCRLSTISLRSN
jgi:hypothetical protein